MEEEHDMSNINIDFDISNEQYHLSDALSASGAKTIATKSLADFKYAKRDWVSAFDIGTATHTFVLEPELSSDVRCGPETRRGKAWAEQKEQADADGALLLTEPDYTLAIDMAQAVFNNEQAAELLAIDDMVAEASVFVKDGSTGADIRCRPDKWSQKSKIILDLKTTTAPDPDGFSRQVASFGYHIQEAFYRRAMREAGEHIERFVFIAVGKSAPHNVGIYELDEDALREGEYAVDYALEQFVAATESGKWNSGFERLQTLELPRWSFKFHRPQLEF